MPEHTFTVFGFLIAGVFGVPFLAFFVLAFCGVDRDAVEGLIAIYYGVFVLFLISFVVAKCVL